MPEPDEDEFWDTPIGPIVGGLAPVVAVKFSAQVTVVVVDKLHG